jgi:SAM-dependent methyltransferase
MTSQKISTIDPVWEEKYSQGHMQKYPWDIVVSFVFNNQPKGRPRCEIEVLEVGFGAGSNLWFAAREGFSVSGIEGSHSAVRYAKNRFSDDGLSGDLRVGDFTELPFAESKFDLVIDRGALTCVGKSSMKKSVREIHRVMKVGGRFLFNGYSDTHSSSRSGVAGHDSVRLKIDSGSLVGVGQICFLSRSDIDHIFSDRWKLHQVQRREYIDMLGLQSDIHSEWMVVAEKIE